MTIIGGFIHRAGIVKLGGFPKKLGFIPDSLYFMTGSEVPRSTSSQFRRGHFGSEGGGSVGRNGDDTFHMAMMPEAGKFKHYEILNNLNTIIVSVDYYILNQETDEELSILTILPSTSGSFIDAEEYAFTKDDHIILKMDRSPSTSGGLSDANMIIGITYDE